MTDPDPELRRRFLALARSDHKTEGASEADITELETYAGGRLPEVYRQYLRHFGRRAGELFRGTESGLDDRLRLRLREPAERLVNSAGVPLGLPAAAFIFLMAQGYQFLYFPTDAGEDPPVFGYLEGWDDFDTVADTLSEYLLRCVAECERRTPALASA